MSTASQRRRISQLRLVAQRLVGEPWETAAEAARAMMCMQGQDWAGALLSLALRTRARSVGSVREAFDAGLIVRSWPQRGTLHVVPAEDIGWYLKLTAQPRLMGQEKRRTDRGITAHHIDKVRDLTVTLLHVGGPGREAGRSGEKAGGSRGSDDVERAHGVSRDALIACWEENGVPSGNGWGYYLLHHLCVEGTLVQGPIGVDGKQLFVLAEDWIQHPRALDRVDAAHEVVARYLASHGPASRKDINWWSQLPLREIDQGIEACSAELTGIDVDGETYWVYNSVMERAEAIGSATLSRSLLALPGFDELILGYGSRWMTIPAEHAQDLVPGNNGVFRKSIIQGGTAVGFWRPGATKPANAGKLADGRGFREPGATKQAQAKPGKMAVPTAPSESAQKSISATPVLELFKEPSPALSRRLENTFARLPI
ncbi:MAG: winged helix DNA-binding domain-containing protein [Ancrocorticia sp.]|uniref:winged helix DNA-binding domain-containing protein n=1 Tax=Ancrocorticia sp. TaxID=2593684 RepID=UPI003F9386D1